MKKKLLFVISALNTGGAEKSLVNLLNQMDYSRYDVELLLFKNHGPFLKQVPKEVNIIESPYDLYCLYNKPIIGENFFIALRQTVVRITGSFYKKIFFTNEFYPGMQARWNLFYKRSLGKLNGTYDVAISFMHGESMYYVAEKVQAKKKITWVHNDYRATKLSPQKDYPYFRCFDQVITVSEECVNIWRESFSDMGGRIQYIPNITSSVFTRRMAETFYPSEYTGIRNKKILISIGRLSQQKGFDIAIDAAKVLKERGVDFYWFVIGQGELEKNLQEQIKKNRVEECFSLLGVRENPYPYIKHAYILVQTSRFEGKSVVLDETKILAKPFVVTNYSTVCDQVINGKEGIVANIEPEDIADSIMKLLEDKALYKEIESYLEVHEYGNIEEMKKYYDVFDS